MRQIPRSIAEATKAFKDGTLRPTTLAEMCLANVERFRWTNCMIPGTSVERQADVLEQAKLADKRWAAGNPLGTLDGIPFTVKDNFCVQGMNTQAASRMLHKFTAPYSATVVERLCNRGAVLIGKTNMDEFGMGSLGLNSVHGPTYSPWSSLHNLHEEDTNFSHCLPAGGSSSGSAVAVATGACLLSLGSDTGGSVRLPAAYCGVVGFKPSYGLLSRHGLIAYASSLDCPGTLTNTIADAALVLQEISGFDENDSTSVLPQVIQKCKEDTEPRAKGGQWRIGLPQEVFVNELSTEVRQAWEDVSRTVLDLGGEVVPVSVPSIKGALAAYYVIAAAEASSNLSRYDGVRYGYRPMDNDEELVGSKSKAHHSSAAAELHSQYIAARTQGFGSEVQRRLLMGTFALSSGAVTDFYDQAVQLRADLKQEISGCFEQHKLHALLTPVSPSPPKAIKDLPSDPVEGYTVDVMTVPASLAGLPAVAFPVATHRSEQNDLGAPIGLQLIGRRYMESELIELGEQLENRIQFSLPKEFNAAD